MTEHNYKAALRAFELRYGYLPADEVGRTIRRALLLADKIMQEPSAQMMSAGSGYHYELNTGSYYKEAFCEVGVFKAMCDQALKEIG